MRKAIQGSPWVWLLVATLILVIRASGAIQPLELGVYDRLVSSLTRPTAVSERIALVEISERDIQALGHWPMSDLELTRLIGALFEAGASAVGVDLYRDLPVSPGVEDLERLLQDEPRIVLVFKHGDPASGGIPGRATLEGSGRLGFGDLVLDPDGRVRRALLFLERADGGSDFAFPLQLALLTLASRGVHPTPDPDRPEWLRLGPTSMPFLESEDGGYRGIDDQGYQLLHDFAQSRGDFEGVAFLDALSGRIEENALAGRIVLVGASAESLNDFALVPGAIAHGTPSERGVTGVWLHALFLDQLLRYADGDSKPTRFSSEPIELLSILLAAILGALLAASVGRLTRLSTVALTLGAAAGVSILFALGSAALAHGQWVPIAAPGLAWIGGIAAQTAWLSGRERLERAELMQIFSQVQSPRVANELWRRRREYLVEGRLEPEAAIVTVLFLDMKGYTSSAEKLSPSTLMQWINDFMAPMAQLIEEHGGYPDDYFGDGIKADFGVPVLDTTEDEITATARRAVRCARSMNAELARINAGYAADGLPTVALRVGIHTGPVVVGLLGSLNKAKYTVVGDAVVTAQRLESTERVTHDFEDDPCRILVSAETFARLDESERAQSFESVGEIALKGKSEQIAVYRLLSGREQDPTLD